MAEKIVQRKMICENLRKRSAMIGEKIGENISDDRLEIPRSHLYVRTARELSHVPLRPPFNQLTNHQLTS